MSARKGWRWSALLSCVLLLMLLLTSAADGQGGPETIAPALGEPTLEEVLFYISRIDTLEVDLAHCREIVADCEKPEGGTSWTLLAVAVGVGFLLGLAAK